MLLYLRARYKVRTGGRAAYLKVYEAGTPEGRKAAGKLARKELKSLKLLRGLNVPEPVALSAAELRRAHGRVPARWVATAAVPGKPFDAAGLDRPEMLGAWLFSAEMLAAYRARGVLYTDIKPANLLVRRKPLRVTQIDFNLCVRPRDDGHYPPWWFGYTFGRQAPEHGQRWRHGEQTLTYQLGMLLVEGWTGAINWNLRSKQGLPALQRELKRLGARRVAAVVRRLLDPDFKNRPRDYAAAWRDLRAAALADAKPARALEVWRALRAPYAAELGA